MTDQLTDYLSVITVLENQSIINGVILLVVAIVFLIGAGTGVYLIRDYLKAKETADKWVLHVGLILLSVCGILFFLFLWLAIPRLINPSYYALEQLKGLHRFKKFLDLPWQ